MPARRQTPIARKMMFDSAELDQLFQSACRIDGGLANYDKRLNDLSDSLQLLCQFPEARDEALAWVNSLKPGGTQALHGTTAFLVPWLTGLVRFSREELSEAAKEFTKAMRRLGTSGDGETYHAAKLHLHNWRISLGLGREDHARTAREWAAAEATNRKLSKTSLSCRIWFELLRGKRSFRLGQIAEAAEALERCETMLSTHPGREGLLHAELQRWRSRILFQRGCLDEALEHVLDSLRIRERIGDEVGSAESLLLLGLVYQARGDTATARAHLETALEKATAHEVRSLEGACLSHLRDCHLAEGRLPAAEDCLHRATWLSKRTGSRKGRFASHHGFLVLRHRRALLIADESERLRALGRLLDRARQLLRNHSSRLTLRRRARLLAFIARLREDSGARVQAIDDYELALKSLSRMGMTTEAVETLLRLAPLCASAGRSAEAAAHFVEALDLSAVDKALHARVESVVDGWLDSLPPADFCRRLVRMERDLAEASHRFERERREWRSRVDYVNRQKMALWLAIGHLAASAKRDPSTAGDRLEEIFRLCFDRPECFTDPFEDDRADILARESIPLQTLAGVVSRRAKDQVELELRWVYPDASLATHERRLADLALSCVRLLRRFSPDEMPPVIDAEFAVVSPSPSAPSGETRLVFECRGRFVDPARVAELLSGNSPSAKPREIGLCDSDWPDLNLIHPSARLAGANVRFESSPGEGTSPGGDGARNRFVLTFVTPTPENPVENA